MLLHYRGYANPAYLKNFVQLSIDAADKDMLSSLVQDRQWEISMQTATNQEGRWH